jgi:hypothetical protein
MFVWLEMAAAVLELNPADLVVDETLPSPPITSGVTTMFGKQPTDEEIKAALPLRTAARQTVADALQREQGSEKHVKKNISKAWPSLSPKEREERQTMLDMYKLPEYKDFINFLKTELVWWNTNIKLSTLDVNTRSVNFNENFKLKQDIFRKANDQSRDSSKQQQSAADDAQNKAKQAILNRSVKDDIWDSFIISLQWIGIIIYILLALRFASFAANANLYKPLPYRFLAFIYTFIFAPIVAPYYLWREIKALIWPGIVAQPLYESFFPIIPYNPTEELTMNRRLYGYADTEGLRSWIQRQIAKDLEGKEKAISTDIFADVILEAKQV